MMEQEAELVDFNYESIHFGHRGFIHSWVTLVGHIFNLPFLIIKLIVTVVTSLIILTGNPSSWRTAVGAVLQLFLVLAFGLVILPVAGLLGLLYWEPVY